MGLETPTNKTELIQHCKKRVSILNVNISSDQEKILAEKAIKKYLEYHQDSTEKNFVAQQVTADMVANGYFVTPENVYEVNNVLSFRAAISGSNLVFSEIGSGSNQSFYIGGQGAPASGFGTYSSGIIHYFLAKQNHSLYESLFQRDDLFRWSRTSRKLRIVGNQNLELDKYILYEADISLQDQELFWQNEWLIEYLTALMKRTWGENLSKFSNVELPGGIQINSADIKTEAKDSITELEQELISVHANYKMIYIS